MKPTTKEAYKLFHEGALALAEVERVGMRIDVDLLDKTIGETKTRIKKLSNRLRQDRVWKLWKRRWGDRASLGSRYQLGEVLFGKDGDYKSKGKTKTGRDSVDAAALEQVDEPFVKYFLKLEKLKNLVSTHLNGVRREVVDGYVHPSLNLHLARTFRPSSNAPNSKNIPMRDGESAKQIRSCFIPRDGCLLVEMDYSAIEFKVAGCHWKDDAMVSYGSDASLDIHRDMAAECYCLHPDQVNKDVRFYAKNQFVFPMLYGSYYISCARNLWSAITSGNLRGPGDNNLFDCLEEVGIDRLGECNPKWDAEEGTFEKHILEVEERFNGRFPQWSERKEQWWERYQKRGWFRMMTGFECSGIYTRNNLYNYPIQGPAYHLLLWSLIRMVRWLKKNKMKSRVINDIYDSIVMDVAKEELDNVVAKAKQLMTVDVRKAWDWVITPLSIECEISETNWFDKKELVI